MAVSVHYGCACGVPLACRGHVLVENYISTRSTHFSTVFFHTCLKLGNRQSGQAVFAWGRDFHTLFHTLWKTAFCGFVAGCRTGVGYDIFCDFCIIGLACLLGYLVNRVGLWGGRGVVARRPCLAGTRRGACLLCRLPTLPLAYFLAPHPPDPLPLRGRGRFKVFLCKGLRPLHPRGLNPGGIGFSCGKRCPRGASPLAGRGEGWRCGARMGACPGGRPPTLPCRNPAGAYLFGRLPTFCFSLLSFPHPPDPLPGGKGGTKGYFMQGASPLASPALNRLRHLQTLPFRYPGASLPWNRA